jgi:putative hydrolase of the HAD superfamily
MIVVLFDIDDTLIDHSSAFAAATMALHEQGGFDIPHAQFVERWSSAHRRNFDRYLLGELSFEEQRRARVREAIDATLGDTEADRLFDYYLSVYEASWRLFDDVLPCLNALPGVRLGVISNGQSAQQRSKLERLRIADRFEHIVISEECGSAKPDARIFAAAAAKFGCGLGEGLYVGDSYALDARAARAVGLRGVWLDRRGEAGAEHEPPVIGGLAELPALVAGVHAAK